MNKNLKYILKANITVKTLFILFLVAMLFNTTPLIVEASDTISITKNFNFSKPIFETNINGYTDVIVEEAPLFHSEPGEPKLPRLTEVITLPYMATVESVEFSHSQPQTETIPKVMDIVAPGPVPMPLLPPGSKYWSDIELKDQINMKVYNSREQYPEKTCTYRVGVGRDPATDKLTKFVIFNILPCVLSCPADNVIKYYEDFTVTLKYKISEFQTNELDGGEIGPFDLLIISANDYVRDLQPLVDHKENMGLSTKLVSLSEVYNEYDAEIDADDKYFDIPDDCPYKSDNQEKIKYFIYKALREWDVKYVMAVGGYRTFFGFNNPDMQFPIEWRRDIDNAEPGYACELYYSCCMKSDYSFDDWSGIVSEDPDGPGGPGDTHSYDRYPDVYFGRLACRNKMEVRTLVNKIIRYETSAYGEEWFNSFMSVGGDGFQDVGHTTGTGVSWPVSSVPDGEYTIYAQSGLESDPSIVGLIDEVHITVDHSAPSSITFHETDHLMVEPIDLENQTSLYPGLPVAHIVVPSEHDVIGNTNVTLNPAEAYCSDSTGWARIQYENNILIIRTKSYDPSPKDNATRVTTVGGDSNPNGNAYNFASRTLFKVWINDSDDNVVFGPITQGSVLYFENELTNQIAHDYIPHFEARKLWTSNGNFSNMRDVIDGFSEGHGFVYINGHSSCMSWMDHYPGIPGGRRNGGVVGYAAINTQFGLARYAKEEGDPLLPIGNLYNGEKLPIFLYSGCHSGQFDTSFLRLFSSPYEVLFGDLYNTWTPEGAAWWTVRIPQGGSIATIGNTALGMGYLGVENMNGLGGWLYSEFFNVYSQGYDMLGKTYTKTQINFAHEDAPDGFHQRTHEIWNLLGDPSLKIGGYPPETSLMEKSLSDESVFIGDFISKNGKLQVNVTNNMETGRYFNLSFKITEDNPLAQYFGLTGTIFEGLFRGRILSGIYHTKGLEFISPHETLQLEINPFGIGHIEANVTVCWNDDTEHITVLEDGFLFGNRLLVYHSEV